MGLSLAWNRLGLHLRRTLLLKTLLGMICPRGRERAHLQKALLCTICSTIDTGSHARGPQGQAIHPSISQPIQLISPPHHAPGFTNEHKNTRIYAQSSRLKTFPAPAPPPQICKRGGLQVLEATSARGEGDGLEGFKKDADLKRVGGELRQILPPSTRVPSLKARLKNSHPEPRNGLDVDMDEREPTTGVPSLFICSSAVTTWRHPQLIINSSVHEKENRLSR